MCLPKGEGKRDFVMIKIDMLDLNLESFINLEETQECDHIYGLSKTSDHQPFPLMQVLSFVLPMARLIVLKRGIDGPSLASILPNLGKAHMPDTCHPIYSQLVMKSPHPAHCEG